MSAKAKRVILSWFICISLILSTAVLSHAYNSILSFGDSLTDNGYYQGYPGGTAGNTNPADVYGYMPFSNGPVWVEYLANSSHLNVPLLDLAYVGATTGSDNPALGSSIWGLQWQVAQIGSISSSTLVTVWAGANDFFQGRPYNTAASNVASAIQQLANDGGKYFLVPYLPNIGLTPEFRGTSLQAAATAWSQAFNLYLANDLLTLESANPGDYFYTLDTFSLIDAVIANPAAYGFINVTDSGGGNPPPGYLFWDGIHPTTQGHLLLADYAMTAVPEPATILLLGLGLIGLAGVRRKFKQ